MNAPTYSSFDSTQAFSLEMTGTELDRAGLLHAEGGVRISRYAVFLPADAQGTRRPVGIGPGAVIGPFAVVHGGTIIAEGAYVAEHAVVGKPEQGYAVGHGYPGVGGGTTIGEGSVVRAGATVYNDVVIGAQTVVGHGTLLRTGVRVGTETQLGHHLCIERGTRIGCSVRCSPGSHITSCTILEDRVFLGAGVLTINDKSLTWRNPHRTPILNAPRFEEAAKVGSGSVILAGITIGENALVGAVSLVTHDIPAGALAYGHPARVQGKSR